MNIFRLHDDPKIAAKLYNDKHLIKIIVEISQVLANCFTKEQLEKAPKTQSGKVRKYSHYNHPISSWVRQFRGNTNWTVSHGLALCEEFEYRFGKKHFCEEFIKWVAFVGTNNPMGLSEQPQCFLKHPDCIVPNNPVAGYRNYYNKCKLSFTIRGKTVKATWTKRNIPDFIDLHKLNN